MKADLKNNPDDIKSKETAKILEDTHNRPTIPTWMGALAQGYRFRNVPLSSLFMIKVGITEGRNVKNKLKYFTK